MADLFEVSPPTIQSMPDAARRDSLRLPEPRPRRVPKTEPVDEALPEDLDAPEEDSKRQLDVTA